MNLPVAGALQEAPDPVLWAHAQDIYTRLVDFFGLPDWRSAMTAVDELVCTILSQNTNDRNRDLAYNRLRERFPTWEEVRDAPSDEVIETIRPAGLANQKGPRLQQVLRDISAERGSLDLEFLRAYPPDEACRWLMRFNGVGPKTAAIVLLFALDLPGFPVDTHVYRVSGRLGLRPERMTVEQAHPHLAALFEPAQYGPAHLNLIRLGREICTARQPFCERCPLLAVCPFGHARMFGASGV